MTQRRKPGRPKAPAEGERAAIGGYAEQYRASAILILHGLHQQSLEWIRLADPKAGRVDDFQLGKAGQVDAYQFKWSQHRGKFSLSDLLTESKDAPPLIRQLADGWKRLCNLHMPKRVVVHLVSNDLASDSDSRPGIAPSGRRLHFAPFVEEAWNPVRGRARLVPADWTTVWEEVRVASGLSQVEFFDFVECCALDLGWTDPANDPRPSLQNVDDFEDDLRTIRERLLEAVASPQRIIEMSVYALVVYLGWQCRISLRNIHSFPDPPLGYCEISETIQGLQKLINNTPSGYLALVGAPGSGKSTLVSKSLATLKHRVVRYFAFVLNAATTNSLRGESVVFFHDLVTLLSDFGLHGGPGLPKPDRLALLARLGRQLQEAHADWLKTGRKTIIVVDGLDHIPREQSPTRSLLVDLPLPADVPDGVLFLLGSQTIELEELLPSVRHQLRESQRVVNIQPLPRADLLNWLASLPVAAILSHEQREKIYTLTGGHPLAVNLLLQRLSTASRSEETDEILANVPLYLGSTDTLYDALWTRDLEQTVDDDLRRLLALVARLRNGFDAPLLTRLAHSQQNVLKRFVTGWLHLFRRDGERWLPFHNSVRLFLASRTAETAFRQYSPELDRHWHSQVAQYLGTLASDDPWSWELAYHRQQADEHRDVLALVNPARIRQQLCHFRPIADVREEILIGLRSAKALRDVGQVVRLVFVMLELSSRADNLENAHFDIPSLLLHLALHDGSCQAAARSQLRSGHDLHVGATSGLHAAQTMLKLDAPDEARRLFELAEPWSVIKSSETHSNHFGNGDLDLLETWVTTAVHFRPIEEIEAIIAQLKDAPWLNQGHSEVVWNTPPSYEEVRVRLLYCLGLAANEISDRRAVELIIGRLRDAFAEEWLITLLHEVAIENLGSDRPFATECSQSAVEIMKEHPELDDRSRVLAAELAFRVLQDASTAKGLLSECAQPELVRDHGNVSFSNFTERLRLNRLLYALGARLPLTEVVPDAGNEHGQPLVYFERAVTRLGQLWGAAWTNAPTTPGLFLIEVKPLFKIFETARRASHADRTRWYKVIACQADFTDLVVRCARQCSLDHVSELAQYLSGCWTFGNDVWT